MKKQTSKLRQKMNVSNKTLKKLKCGPKLQKDKKDYTCYTDNELHRLKTLWNSRHGDDRINSNNSKYIHERLTTRLLNTCDKESCWLKQLMNLKDVSKNDLLASFAPVAPSEWKKNRNVWLSSADLVDVMKQYEMTYKCFAFLGPSPIDFDTRKLYGTCVWEELCNFNLAEMITKKKNKIGIIFNTDPHYKSGSHWVSLFINIKKKQIFYFDSVGTKVPKQIMTFVTRVMGQGLEHNIKFSFDSNEGYEHQKGNTECGMYSLYFIVHMVEDKMTKHYLKTHRLKDKYIESFHKIYFNESI